MTAKKPLYKIKCEGCGRYIMSDKIIRCYGHNKCLECLSITTVQGSNLIYMSANLMKRYDLKSGNRVKLIPMRDDFLVKKIKTSSPKK